MAGERYGRKVFEYYAQKATDLELRSLLQEIIENKQHHILITIVWENKRRRLLNRLPWRILGVKN
ncbi:hypothetical protein [Coleofasciculus sp. F4-SAH-05]|uniref:hypothetical protein n=1 Tax=Coleofasciculus sp. F4-SAH-05 TaxID=3069525 RepID=UPI003302DEA4